MTSVQPVRRALFVATILTSSFLLFLVQPMVARMALPKLGGAPNVWNSAMLVYQALLLAGYGYAHWLGRLALRRQAQVHIGLLLIGTLTLPIALAKLPPPVPGTEVFWVPFLFLLSIGPVFFLVSAQAPLMQRWFAAHPQAGEPWALYAASNFGSFAGLLAYPLVAEPLLDLHDQSLVWSMGYGLLIILVAVTARERWNLSEVHQVALHEGMENIGIRRTLLWLALSAIPSGLMLSTTTHLTTDIFAMPLLWVIPLGLYLLSFVAAFSDRRGFAQAVTFIAPFVMLVAGGMAMVSRPTGTMVPVFTSVLLLFVVAVTLHARLYALRPPASQLTRFYFVMSAGGALGGLFTALFAPLVFDWVWEHPLLVIAAAVLMPAPHFYDWRRLPGLEPGLGRAGAAVLLAIAAVLSWQLWQETSSPTSGWSGEAYTLALAVIGLLLLPWRRLYLTVLALLLMAQGGIETAQVSLEGARTRSYFGIYTVIDHTVTGHPELGFRTLAHGTTLHGQQSLDPAKASLPLSYYGPTSGAALALVRAQQLYGTEARVGIVGLGTGTLACWSRPGEHWRYFEIDPAVLALSRKGTFTYLQRCARDAIVSIGDARLTLAGLPHGTLDILAIDAFSSDAIPLHLLTDEAFGTYFNALVPRGVLLVHISNRFIELEPVLAALARKRGLFAIERNDNPANRYSYSPSSWVMLSRDPAVLADIVTANSKAPWATLGNADARAWTDDHASVLPYVRWHQLLRKPGT